MDSGCRCNRWADYSLSNISVAGWALDSYAVTDNREQWNCSTEKKKEQTEKIVTANVQCRINKTER